ncbi:FAD-binding oxidoreductase [Actinocrispum sp. NPDC049592]|uniref:FAD-binding oxidoreductase n=1 Tax=Actinocrispum sp. NPDC049592 TaxID=3154835 RepID=UPI0034155EC1
MSEADDIQAATTVHPGDPQYASKVRGSNQRWAGTPETVRLVNSTDQVVAAVQEAVTAGKRIGIRSGGHCYEDFAYNGTHTLIDVSGLNQIAYDPIHNAISVGAGATLIQIYETLHRVWGVTIPGGSCASVGAGGHITGGGYGLASRQFGLTVDYLYGVEVVTVDSDGRAKAIVATCEADDPHRELWWAHTGGGGGNFGVVTRFLFGAPGMDPAGYLPRPPAEIFLSAVALNWADVTETDFTRLVDNFGKWHERNSAPDSAYAGIFGLLKANKKTWDGDGNVAGQIVLVTQADGAVSGARGLLDDYLTAVFDGVAAPRVKMIARSGDHPSMPEFLEPQRLPWLDGTYAMSGSSSWTFCGDYKSAYLRRGYTPAQIAATYEWLATPDYNNPRALVQIDSYGCRINAVAPGDTAVPQRDSVLKLQYQVYWTDPAEEALHLGWIRGFYGAVYADTGGVPVPNAVTDGCYVNYPDVDLGDGSLNRSGVAWSSLYYKGNYPRLRRVKAAYDPLNVFWHRQSVEP